MPDPVTNPQPNVNASLQEIDALVVKHRIEIDRIKRLDSGDQMVVFKDLGVDPEAVMGHYKDLVQRSDKLKRTDDADLKKAAIAGWGGFVAGGAAALAMGRRLGTKLIRAISVTLITVASGVASSFFASRVFSGRIREDSRLLTLEAKNAFERELAVALENKQRQEKLVMPEVPSLDSPAASISPRDTSFAAQAAADKAIVAAALNQRT